MGCLGRVSAGHVTWVDNYSSPAWYQKAFTMMATSGHSRKVMRTVAVRVICSYEQKLRKSQLPKDDPGYAPLTAWGERRRKLKRREVGTRTPKMGTRRRVQLAGR